MIIDNRFATGKYKMAFIITMSLFLFSTLFLIFSHASFIKVLNNATSNEILFTYLVSTVTLVYFLYLLFLDLHYFYYNDEKNKIIVRYYKAFPFFRKYKAFEIPYTSIQSFEIKKSFFGMKKYLIINYKTYKSEGQYPAISITALKDFEIAKLTKALNEIIRLHKK